MNIEILAKEYESGQSSLELAEKYNCSKTTILRYLKKANVNIRSNSRKGKKNKEPLSKKSNLLGKVFNQLTVIDYVYGGCLCRCSCGREKIIYPSRLLDGSYKTCGCGLKGKDHPLWKGCGPLSANYFHSIRLDAKRRNLVFDITIEDMYKVFQQQKGICKISGVAIDFENNTASLDRIDSLKGYHLDNIQWLHKIVNEMKWDYNQKEFINWCRLITLHQT